MHMQTGTITFDSTTLQALQMQENPLEWLTVILPYRSLFSMSVRLTPKYQVSRAKAVVRRGFDRQCLRPCALWRHEADHAAYAATTKAALLGPPAERNLIMSSLTI